MKTALLSVSDKTGIIEFAQGLERLGYRLLSTGGTYRALDEAGVGNLMEVADFTGFPEGLEGRIKTLTPEIFGGVLNLRNNPDHQKFCTDNNIENIDNTTDGKSEDVISGEDTHHQKVKDSNKEVMVICDGKIVVDDDYIKGK